VTEHFERLGISGVISTGCREKRLPPMIKYIGMGLVIAFIAAVLFFGLTTNAVFMAIGINT